MENDKLIQMFKEFSSLQMATLALLVDKGICTQEEVDKEVIKSKQAIEKSISKG